MNISPALQNILANVANAVSTGAQLTNSITLSEHQRILTRLDKERYADLVRLKALENDQNDMVCQSKRRFETRTHAIRFMRKGGVRKQQVYPCTCCNGWHLRKVKCKHGPIPSLQKAEEITARLKEEGHNAQNFGCGKCGKWHVVKHPKS